MKMKVNMKLTITIITMIEDRKKDLRSCMCEPCLMKAMSRSPQRFSEKSFKNKQ